MNQLKYVRNIRNFKKDPPGTLIDSLIFAVVNLIIPAPIAARIVTQFRGPILGLILGVVTLVFFILITVGIVLLTPFAVATGFFSTIAATNNLPNEGFIQSISPSRNPLGGTGMEFTSITAGFLDPSYFLKFGKNHTGIDLVPNATYYHNSQTYKETHKIIVFATHTGIARFYTDKDGGETIEITNNDNSLKTIYIHFKNVFVNTGNSIQAGQAIGEMGMTGFATGEHVHYEIRIKDGSNWYSVNPLTYIK